MNKFDPESIANLLAVDEALARHPKPSDGPPRRFPVWNKPLVKINDIYGEAHAYTRSYGLIGWKDNTGREHLEWFHADQIKRVERENWHGRP